MIRPLRAFVDFWDRRESPTVLAMIRIAVGACLAGDFLMARGLGLVEATWAPSPVGIGYGFAAKPLPFPLAGFDATPHTAWTFWLAALVCSVLFAFGAGTRLSGVGLVIAMTGLAKMTPDADRGIDQLLRIVLCILVLSRANAIWSFDAWLKSRALGIVPPSRVPAWPRYLIFIQLSWMYFSAGIGKHDPAWGFAGGFTALARVLCDPHYAAYGPSWIAVVYPFTKVGTAATMAFELGAPVFVFASMLSARKRVFGSGRAVDRAASGVRAIWLVTGFAFHIGIAVTMRLGLFPFGVLALWPAFFAPRDVERAFRWLCSRCLRRSSATARRYCSSA